ncbi:hypothetical protein [Klebsiella grimontii]|uniref:hypothetical protein n=1 Tax=Klebsiella grimontii TaxID=2058152 RepID=UPI001CCC0A26|nr:hypothetical protein [Klebsiella grimontii]MBZ7361095.1 hypothetical protein [Klebsiella grimontii]
MSYLIYLDQNTLSNLRQRKIDEMKLDEYIKLKAALKLSEIITVYSYVTLQEISQIKNDEYKKEHIELLAELNAAYIEPKSNQLTDIAPEKIWKSFLQIQKENSELGIDSIIDSTELFSRKISGIHVDESFDDIKNKVNESLNNMLECAEKKLDSIEVLTLPNELQQKIIDLQSNLKKLLANSLQITPPLVACNQQLGPTPFRQLPQIKILDILNADVKDVVNLIETAFQTENSTFNLNDYFEKTPQSDSARAYCLMNWAGYYSDDFTKVTEKKDRFKSSRNDMQHVVAAIGANFLISDDARFCRKAQACYAYIGISTIVCSAKYFIENYCRFD